MRLRIITLFPEFFEGPLATGLVGKALSGPGIDLGYVDPRDFTQDKHRTVDDSPYGGGAGMVMKPEPLAAAIDTARADGASPVVLMSPQGRPLQQADLVRWSEGPGLTLVAGRYEGFDERIRQRVDEEISLGDFVLTGGEYAALAIIDGLVRLLPGTVGNKDSLGHDSFSHGLLEHPHYTRPEEFEGEKVPDVLLSGHHKNIESWRLLESMQRTRARRPDLLKNHALTEAGALDALRKTTSTSPRVTLLSKDESPELAAIAEAYGASIISSESQADGAKIKVGLEPDSWLDVPMTTPAALMEAARSQTRSILLCDQAATSDVELLLRAPRTAFSQALPRLALWAVVLDRLVGEA